MHPFFSSHFLKVFLMHPTDCHSIATEVEDKLAVAVDADDVTLITLEGTCENS